MLKLIIQDFSTFFYQSVFCFSSFFSSFFFFLLNLILWKFACLSSELSIDRQLNLNSANANFEFNIENASRGCRLLVVLTSGTQTHTDTHTEGELAQKI